MRAKLVNEAFKILKGPSDETVNKFFAEWDEQLIYDNKTLQAYGNIWNIEISVTDACIGWINSIDLKERPDANITFVPHEGDDSVTTFNRAREYLKSGIYSMHWTDNGVIIIEGFEGDIEQDTELFNKELAYLLKKEEISSSDLLDYIIETGSDEYSSVVFETDSKFKVPVIDFIVNQYMRRLSEGGEGVLIKQAIDMWYEDNMK